MRNNKASSLVEYALPLALLALVVGMSLYHFYSNGVLKSAVVGQSDATEELLSNRFSIGPPNYTEGVFKEKNGDIFLYNADGISIQIQQSYLDKYKKDMASYLKNGKFNFVNDSSLGMETSGATGLTEETNYAPDQTYMLASLVEIAGNNYDDATAKELLEDMSTYGKKLAVLEDNLITIDDIINNRKVVFASQEDTFDQLEADFENALKLYDEGKISIDELRACNETLQEAYETYEGSVTDIEEVTDQYISMAESFFDDLKNQTGVKFDDVLQQIKDSTLIDDDVKELTVPIAEDIKKTKDSAELIKQTIDYIVGTFSKTNDSFESLQEEIETIEFEIQQQNNGNGNGNGT